MIDNVFVQTYVEEYPSALLIKLFAQIKSHDSINKVKSTNFLKFRKIIKYSIYTFSNEIDCYFKTTKYGIVDKADMSCE